MSTSKKARLKALAQVRQATRISGHYCLADFHNGLYECDFVSPWTKSASNVDAEIILIAQDWASSEFLERYPDERIAKYGQDASLPTNRNLANLLERHFGLKFSDTYATNLFPFIKPGPMDAPIKPKSALIQCARDFLLPQIEIVRPKMVVCLGSLAIANLRSALGYPPLKGVDQTAMPIPHTVYGNTEIYGVAHTGQLGTNYRNRSKPSAVDDDWAGLASRLKEMRLRS